MRKEPPLTRREKLGNVVNLCRSFGRNLAYYRAGWTDEHRHLLESKNVESVNFWRTVNGNFLDICVLEWCKLFGDKNSEYYWKNISYDVEGFKADLLFRLGLKEEEFKTQIKTIREYRDKWVAHLDTDRSGFFPELEAAKNAVWFYYERMVQQESDLSGLPVEIDSGYEQCVDEAKAIYGRSELTRS
jgi:hypothetical protein